MTLPQSILRVWPVIAPLASEMRNTSAAEEVTRLLIAIKRAPRSQLRTILGRLGRNLLLGECQTRRNRVDSNVVRSQLLSKGAGEPDNSCL